MGTNVIHQLVYFSAAVGSFSEEDLTELLAVARENNGRLGISGMLLYDAGSFIQVLEGERDAVEALFDKIERDPRHTGTRILARGEIDERAFGDWTMGFARPAQCGALPEGLNEFLRKGFDPDAELDDGAHRALTSFREGRWRAAVET